MIRQLAAVFILVILLLNIIGYYPLFKWEQWNIRKEAGLRIRKSIQKNELHLITVPESANKTEWTNEGTELNYNGQMYDIAYFEKHADSVYFYCITDDDENVLFARLDEVEKKQMDEKSNQGGKTTKDLLKIFLSLDYLITGNNLKSQIDGPLNQLNYLSLFYSSIFIEKTTPPPKLTV